MSGKLTLDQITNLIPQQLATMPAPSALAITTSSVQRLLKEETSYHKELADQEKTVQDLEAKSKAGAADEDGNGAFMLKQQVRGKKA